MIINLAPSNEMVFEGVVEEPQEVNLITEESVKEVVEDIQDKIVDLSKKDEHILFPDIGALESEFSQGDLNADGVVNILDVVLMAIIALDGPYNLLADLNDDGLINVLDVVILVNMVLDG